MAPRYSAEDYLSALKALLPTGAVWEAASGSVQEQVLSAIALGLSRVDGAAVDLLIDSFPSTTDQLLTEWESSTGLPDPCAGTSPTLQQRQAQVVARVANSGGQSAAYFVAYAKQLGFDVQVRNYATFRVGASRVGDPLNGPDWAHTWAIQAPLESITPFRAGRSTAGEPLQAFGNAVLECELAAIKPAQSILLFLYV